MKNEVFLSIDLYTELVVKWSANACLDIVSRVSLEVFRQMALWAGEMELIAENNSVKSSFLASSSTADTCEQSRINI